MRPLDVQGSATFNSSGVALLELGPVPTWEDWTFRSLTVSTTSTPQTAVKVYRNAPAPTNLLDGSTNGNGNTTDTVFNLRPGEWLSVEWTGGTPGATATAVGQGERG